LEQDVKTKPMKHQTKGVKLLSQHAEHYGLGCEQGTGKTWMLLAEAEMRCESGEIDALVVVAPNGVHTNWTRREAPTHLEIAFDALAWVSGPNVGQKRELERILDPGRIRGDLLLFTINTDAINTESGFNYLKSLLKKYRCMVAVDESQRIKSPKAGVTERMISLAPLCEIRRIASGTMMPNGPPDLFSQFEFLLPGGELLGTSSYRAFVSEFAEVLPDDHGTMRHIMRQKFGDAKMGAIKNDWNNLSDAMRKKVPYMEYAAGRLGKRWRPPQIIKKDVVNGMPMWKNLAKLQSLIKPHLYRVLKKDCLDLPPKIYQTYSFQLSKKQMALYRLAEDKLRYERDTGVIDRFTALTKIVKLRQIVSNFIMLDGEATTLMKDNPRLDLLAEVLGCVEGQFIIWASFHEEIYQIVALLKKMEISCVEYHGLISKRDKEVAIDSFQAGQVRGFVGNRQSGGVGLTLTNAITTIVYSNDYNAGARWQSEDRNHRIGTKEAVEKAGANGVLYIDLVAEDTIDERIVVALQHKEATASAVLNYL
jgi:SNF2 family DNA or RNA helicase